MHSSSNSLLTYACPMACAMYDERCVLRILNINTQNAQFKVCVCNLTAITTITTRRESAESPQPSTNEWDEPMRCKWLPKWNELHHKINMHTKNSSKTHARGITSKLVQVRNYRTSDKFEKFDTKNDSKTLKMTQRTTQKVDLTPKPKLNNVLIVGNQQERSSGGKGAIYY